MTKLYSIALSLICVFTTYAQDIKLIGELKPGNLIIGVGENIDMVQLNDKINWTDNIWIAVEIIFFVSDHGHNQDSVVT